MRLLALFGRNVAAQERSGGMRHVRRSARAQRLGFRKQLRTFMCFTTEEKLAQGASQGKRRRKRGSLSQRLRLTESSEDQSSSLDVMSRLVMRPSTCPPQARKLCTVTEVELCHEGARGGSTGDRLTAGTSRSAADAMTKLPASTPDDGVSWITHGPSSLTLSSLDEEQLNAYLKMMIQRCGADTKSQEEVGFPDRQINIDSSEAGKAATAPVPQADQSPATVSQPNDIETGDLRADDHDSIEPRRARGRLLREKCEQLIRRHEEMFGPIVTAAEESGSAEATPPAPSHCLHQPPPELIPCEPCVPLVPHGAYLTIPQDQDDQSGNADFDEWRHFYRSGPVGVWKVVRAEQDDCELETAISPMQGAPGVDRTSSQRSGGLFGAFRDRCNALFRDNRMQEVASDGFGDSLSAPADDAVKHIEAVEGSVKTTISEAKACEILDGMKDEDIELCTTHPHIIPTFQVSCHDPESYADSSFCDWKRFYHRPGCNSNVYEMKKEEVEPCMTYPDIHTKVQLPCHDPESYQDGSFKEWINFFRETVSNKPPLGTDAEDISVPRPGVLAAPVSGGWLSVSCWWGQSPLLEAALLKVPSAGGVEQRLAAALACLHPVGGPLPRPSAGRLVTWLTQPELPRLFCAAGLGPVEMSRWLLHEPQQQVTGTLLVPVEGAIESVAAAAVHSGGRRTDDDARHRPMLYSGDGANDEPATSPMARSMEEQMAYSVTDPKAPTVEHAVGDVVLKVTDTSVIETPYSRFSAGWGAATKSDSTRATYGIHNIIDSRLNVNAKVFTPACSDPCMFSPNEALHSGAARLLASRAAIESSTAYDTYETRQWCLAGDEHADLRGNPLSVDTSGSTSPGVGGVVDAVGAFDSETELGDHLVEVLRALEPCAAGADHICQLRNASMRPVDSEVDIGQVLDEQSGYVAFGGTGAAPVNRGYQSLPLHEVDSETELGMALPLTDTNRQLNVARHRQVRIYDSEVDMESLITSLHGVDSELEMAERLRRLETWPRTATPATPPDSPEAESSDSELGVGSVWPHVDTLLPTEGRLEPSAERQGATDGTRSSSMSQLPAGPVPVDSETEMGVVLDMFAQGMLSSRYFAGVDLTDDSEAELHRLTSSDSDVNICLPGSHEDDGVQQANTNGDNSHRLVESDAQKAAVSAALLACSAPATEERSTDMYDASKSLSKKIIRKALQLLDDATSRYSLVRKGSSPFGATAGLDGAQLERESPVDADELASTGACRPDAFIPEVSVTTCDGSVVVLFPSRPADTAERYETDERLVVELQRRPRVAESRGFQTAAEMGGSVSQQEMGGSVSQREVGVARRLLASRCADAAVRRQRSQSPRQHASDETGLRVIYRAEGAEPWNPVSPEGLSGVALAPADPELAAVRWRKNSRGEDGDAEAWSAGEATTPPPAESQSQTELSKSKASPPPAVSANSWC